MNGILYSLTHTVSGGLTNLRMVRRTEASDTSATMAKMNNRHLYQTLHLILHHLLELQLHYLPTTYYHVLLTTLHHILATTLGTHRIPKLPFFQLLKVIHFLCAWSSHCLLRHKGDGALVEVELVKLVEEVAVNSDGDTKAP